MHAKHAALLFLLTLGCDQLAGGHAEQAIQADEGDGAGATLPAGASCTGQEDCVASQVCVEGTCRYRTTSRAGEILAAAARGQIEAGDTAGAVRTYAQALTAFREAEAPVPPEIACDAAAAALRVASDPESREAAAAHADRCFRHSLPGDPHRLEVQKALARLRFDGLDVALFDREEPSERFFTKPQTRPTSDAIEIALDLPDRDHTGFDRVSESLRSEAARSTIADCFVQDWEQHHRRSVVGSLVIGFETRMRDMGSYDVFQPEVQVEAGEEGGTFAACVAQGLSETLEAGSHYNRPISSWKEPFEVAARLQ